VERRNLLSNLGRFAYAEALDLFTGKGTDRDRHLLKALPALVGGDDNIAERAALRVGRRSGCRLRWIGTGLWWGVGAGALRGGRARQDGAGKQAGQKASSRTVDMIHVYSPLSVRTIVGEAAPAPFLPAPFETALLRGPSLSNDKRVVMTIVPYLQPNIGIQ